MKEVICLCENDDDEWFITLCKVESEYEINYTKAGDGVLITDNGQSLRDRGFGKRYFKEKRRAIQIIKQYFPKHIRFESPMDKSIKKLR